MPCSDAVALYIQLGLIVNRKLTKLETSGPGSDIDGQYYSYSLFLDKTNAALVSQEIQEPPTHDIKLFRLCEMTILVNILIPDNNCNICSTTSAAMNILFYFI